MKTKILIIDDYNIFRRGLKLLLEKNNDFEVVGEALNGKELFELLEKVKPDVIVMDVMLPEKSVVSITKKLNKEFPFIPFIIITVSVIEHTILECIMNGAKGLIWKESTPDELIQAIKAVAAGESYLQAPAAATGNGISGNNFLEINGSPNENFIQLSARELEILKLIAGGFSYKQIAKKLFISPRTVEAHKSNILSKLGLKTKAQAIHYALKNNLIDF